MPASIFERALGVMLQAFARSCCEIFRSQRRLRILRPVCIVLPFGSVSSLGTYPNGMGRLILNISSQWTISQVLNSYQFRSATVRPFYPAQKAIKVKY